MIPVLNPQQALQEPIENQVLDLPSPKKKKQWTAQHQLITFSLPQENENEAIHRKWRITFKYKIHPSPKIKSQTLYFGQGNDYVDHLNKQKRKRKISQMQHLDNPFHANYWSGILLNKHCSIQEGVAELWEYLRAGKQERRKLYKKKN